ncbi:MAG TPA: hemerythrin domain-containing protein [Candidatus Limnocylindrales bacterium]|nr:hemerythrin domain-containing protein [Candidatus Limnocylindrales bacterium]
MTETRRDTIPEHDFASHEHVEMRRGVERILEVARLHVSNDELSAAVIEVLHWVDHVLEPHAQWEDRWLYPEIDERLGTPWATKLMTFEHQQIREAAHDVVAARLALREHGSTAAVVELRGRLFALDAVLRAHMTREERFLIPLLDEPPAAAEGGSIASRPSAAAV